MRASRSVAVMTNVEHRRDHESTRAGPDVPPRARDVAKTASDRSSTSTGRMSTG